MEHAKKMVLVDARVLYQIKDKNVYEHEKLLEKKHSRQWRGRWRLPSI